MTFEKRPFTNRVGNTRTYITSTFAKVGLKIKSNATGKTGAFFTREHIENARK